MNKMTLADRGYSKHKKKTKCEEFLYVVQQIISWTYWVEMIQPFR